MVRGNFTLVTEFVLLGLTDDPDLQPILFVLFLGIYLITVGGNLGMLLLIRIDSRLHTPMYFFLANLFCLDLCYSANVTPKMLINFLSEKKTISYTACLIQCYFFIAMVITEYYMLAVIGTWPSVILCFIAARCPKGSVSAWLLVHMSMGSLVAWWKPCGPTAWPSVAPTSLITSTVLTHPSSDSHALTPSLRRLIGFLRVTCWFLQKFFLHMQKWRLFPHFQNGHSFIYFF